VTFLPVVERELRLAARKPSTFWLRVIAAAVALGLATIVGLMRSIGGIGVSMLGQIVFGVLTWGALLTALAAGLFLTSDCLSEEKREGTLGFLFLTDLRGYDIVGGKLLASSLRAFYALLALFPILAITLLMGGVTGAQFWKTAVALINALMFSLASGMLVSCFSRDAQKALSATILLLLLFNLGGPGVDALISAISNRGFIARASLASPAFLFTQAAGWSANYWMALFATQAIAWLSLALTSVFLPRAWQQKTVKAVTNRGAYAWKYGGPKRRERLRRKWLSIDPMIWVSCRERWIGAGILVVVLLALVALASLLLANNRSVQYIWSSVGALFAFVFYIWTASHASRFFFELRQSGLMELLLSTPLTEKEIVQGRWLAMRKIVGLPLLIFITVQGFGIALSQHAFTAMVGPGRTGPFVGMAITAGVASVILIVANIAALCWFGMWMGMISKSGNIATLRTYLFVQVVPGIIISLGSTMLMIFVFARFAAGTNLMGPAITGKSFMPAAWFPIASTIVSTALGVAKDVGFILWSRNRLYNLIRVQAGNPIGQSRVSIVKAPPVIVAPSPPAELVKG
jgi:ABC-type transport system involved in multi-copper enzyme maturation permease subunit